MIFNIVLPPPELLKRMPIFLDIIGDSECERLFSYDNDFFGPY